MFPLLADQEVGSLTWCPLASGRLASPYGQAMARSAGDPVARRLFADVDRPIVDSVQSFARARACRWRRSRSAGCWATRWSPPGRRRDPPGHLDDAAAALDVRLTADELAVLERPYTPRLATGF